MDVKKGKKQIVQWAMYCLCLSFRWRCVCSYFLRYHMNAKFHTETKTLFSINTMKRQGEWALELHQEERAMQHVPGGLCDLLSPAAGGTRNPPLDVVTDLLCL